ncbi:hypothetical protein C8R46DRAFT_1233023 [Mycena filopes]|nr:hypothetical protein C8R46DRAFT_1233023 [Mycena filopes]
MPRFTPPSNAPPAYEEDPDAADLQRLLADLNLRAASPEHSPPRPPRVRLPPPSPARLYAYETPTSSGVTSAWSDAAARTQGIPGASPRRLTPQRRSTKKKGGYAVFFGLEIGSYKAWEEVKPLVIGVPSSLFKGYSTLAQAEAAFAYAASLGWTRLIPPSGTLVGQTQTQTAIPRLPHPNAFSSRRNPLHDSTDPAARWYVVYSGVTPGVYQSYLECAINTLGLSSAVHDSFDTQVAAEAAFQRAWDDGAVAFLTPAYR